MCKAQEAGRAHHGLYGLQGSSYWSVGRVGFIKLENLIGKLEQVMSVRFGQVSPGE